MLEPDGSVRLGLRHVRGLGEHAADLVADERARNGSYRDLPDLARRTALDLPRLELLVAAGACDQMGRRRELHWKLGLLGHAVAVRGGHQLALDVEIGETPPAGPPRPVGGARRRLPGDRAQRPPASARAAAGRPHRPRPRDHCRPADLPDGTPVALAGLAVARQRPASANGIVFLLVEDEHGMVNLVLFSQVYEAHRLLARSRACDPRPARAAGAQPRRSGEELLPLDQPGRSGPDAGIAHPPVGTEEPVVAAAGGRGRRLRAVAARRTFPEGGGGR